MSKAPDALWTTSEVCDALSIPRHILRFWEARFEQIKPVQRGRGHRYYRPEDVDLLRGIKRLIEVEGFTTRGAHKVLRERGTQFVQAIGQGERPRLMIQEKADHDDGETSVSDANDGRPPPANAGENP